MFFLYLHIFQIKSRIQSSILGLVRAFLSTYLREDQDILPHRDGDHYCKQHIQQPGAAPLLGPHVQQEDGVAGEGGHQ